MPSLGAQGSCGVGGVIRDSMRCFIACFAASYGEEANFLAEASAVLNGLELCRKLGISRVSLTAGFWLVAGGRGETIFGMASLYFWRHARFSERKTRLLTSSQRMELKEFLRKPQEALRCFQGRSEDYQLRTVQQNAHYFCVLYIFRNNTFGIPTRILICNLYSSTISESS